MKNCQHCSAENKDENVYCISCGSKLEGGAPKKPGDSVSQDTAAANKGSRGLKIFLSIIGAVIVILAISFILLAVLDPGTAPDEKVLLQEEAVNLQDLRKAEMSPDQKKVLSIFGYPDEFVIIFNPEGDIQRAETWIYEAMESSFSFADGDYEESERIITDKFTDDIYLIGPEDIYFSMSPAELRALLGEEGEEFLDRATGLKLISFGQGIIAATFQEDKLINLARLRKVEGDAQ